MPSQMIVIGLAFGITDRQTKHLFLWSNLPEAPILSEYISMMQFSMKIIYAMVGSNGLEAVYALAIPTNV